MRFWFALMVSAACCSAQPAANFLYPPTGQSAGSPVIACSDLYKLTGFEVTVESATLVAAEGETPEYCRIMGLILPEIRFEVA